MSLRAMVFWLTILTAVGLGMIALEILKNPQALQLEIDASWNHNSRSIGYCDIPYRGRVDMVELTFENHFIAYRTVHGKSGTLSPSVMCVKFEKK